MTMKMPDGIVEYEQRANVDTFLRRQRRARVELEVWIASDERKLIESFVRAKICDSEAWSLAEYNW